MDTGFPALIEEELESPLPPERKKLKQADGVPPPTTVEPQNAETLNIGGDVN